MTESTFSFGKPLLAILLLVAAVAAGIWWLENRPVIYEDETGWSVALPNGWEHRLVHGRMAANGPLKDGLVGQATASLHPYAGTINWPDAGLNEFLGERQSQQAIDIAGNRAMLVTFLGTDGYRYVGLAVDRGGAILLYQIGCQPAAFDANREMFEQLARRTQCGKS